MAKSVEKTMRTFSDAIKNLENRELQMEAEIAAEQATIKKAQDAINSSSQEAALASHYKGKLNALLDEGLGV